MRLLFTFKTKYLVFLLPAMVGCALLLRPQAAKADFGFIYQDKKLVAASETVNSWHKPGSVFLTTNLIEGKNSEALLAAEYFNQPAMKEKKGSSTYNYNPALVYKYINGLAQEINLPAMEPELTILNQRAIKFTPPQNGLNADVFESTKSALFALQNGQNTSNLTVSVSEPKTKLSDLNDLGIKELVARGESSFKGSPKNRRHNIKIGVEKMAGVILLPGEEFSFNKFLGPVEADQGFVPELVIKKDGTKPELGGGLCQVSSTTFRAAMAAGLPIKERKNHAYAVQYYSPQGTDATIYPGAVDLRFVNDTPGSLLIWPYLKDKDHLNFDFYGTKDSRAVTLLKPVQYDRREDGSMKATWEREVVKNGVTKKDTFKSVYQSPALFHKEETFVTSSSTPAALPQAVGSPSQTPPQN